ncbi:MAG TPA: amino acid adenylation domain-containing protein [Candidatus Angelobacter sp.]|nr:amino acid adenylation domain-containing protein [Candidatus Angelobacter sp.]
MQSNQVNLLEKPLEERVQEENRFPASFAQEQIWFLEKMEPGGALYNIAGAVRLKGDLHKEALKWGLKEIVRRHEVLRTSFVEVEATPMQIIHNEVRLQFAEKDLHGLGGMALEERVERELREEARRGFELSTPGLLRVRLLQLPEREYVLAVVMHHIIADGWSIGVFVNELKALYEAYLQSRPSPLPELEIQYVDYAAWQREVLASGQMKEGLDYWKRQLMGPPPVLELPTDYSRGSRPGHAGSTVNLSLGKELSGVVRELALSKRVTPYIVLLAGFQALLWRYTGQENIVVGSPMAGRQQAESEKLIGLFTNLVALKTHVEEKNSFLDLLKRAKETAAGAQEYQQVPFEKVVEIVEQERDPSHAPIVQVVFAWQGGLMGGALRLGDLTGKVQQIDTGTAKFDLTLTMEEDQEEIRGWIEYRSGLFAGETIHQLARHYVAFVEMALSHPSIPLAELEFLSGAERKQILLSGRGLRLPAEEDANVLTMFSAHVLRSPHAIAVEFAGRSLTYADLDQRANQLMRYFWKLGVKQESLIGICMERSLETVIAMLAALKSGAAYVSLDSSYPADRLRYMLEDANVQVLCTHSHLLEKCNSGNRATLVMDRDWQRIATEDGSPLPAVIRSENLAYVIYTSGSTGRPKGMQITHRGLHNLCQWHQHAFNLCPEDRSTQVASIGFDASVWEIGSTLFAGATLCFVPEDVRLSAVALRDWLIEHRIMVSFLPTPLAEKVIALDWPAHTALRALLTGGDKLRHVPSQLPFLLSNNYGPTECAVVATSSLVNLGVANDAPPIGRAISNAQTYVLDRHMQLVPAGVAGELYVGGDGVGRGYLRKPELTAERFLPDCFSGTAGARLYRTGDKVRILPDGQLKFLGRADEQVKLRGYRIELEEIASVLRKLPGVRDAVVLVRGGEGEAGEPRLIVYVLSTSAVSAAQLRQHARQQLPDYMVPAACVFLDEFPLTANGKLDRKALPLPETLSETEGETSFTPTEEIVAGVWSSLLGSAEVRRNSNFFELGGHSLLVAQLVSRLRQIFGCEIPVRSIFEFALLSDFSSHIEALTNQAQPLRQQALSRVSRDHGAPLSSAQERLWFLDRFTSSSSAYNIAGAARISGDLDKEVLKKSLAEIVRRHEVLRTSIVEVHGRPIQQICSEVQLQFVERELQGSSTANTIQERLNQELKQEAQYRFELSSPGLLRCTLFQIAPREHVLLLVMHHIIADGWSITVLIRELKALYETFREGMPSMLPELEFQYLDYAALQRELLASEGMKESLDYWKKQLTGAPVLQLSTDFPRTDQPSYEGGMVRQSFGQELSGKLKGLARREGVTLYMVLMAGFQMLLSRYTGQTDIVVGTDVANRNQLGVEGLIGLFVNQLVLRTNLGGNPTFRKLISRVREVTLSAYAHADAPFGKLVELLQPKRDFSRNPLFQVMVIYHNAPLPPVEFSGLKLEPMEIDIETSVFDLSLAFVVETDGEVRASLRHSSLFKTSTAQAMLQDLMVVLECMTQNPDMQVNNVEVRKMEEIKANRTEARFNRLMNLKPKPAVVSNASLVAYDGQFSERGLPVMFRPEAEDVDLASWASANRPEVLERLSKAGATLFRGFKIESLPQFRAFTQSICPELIEYGERSSPRTKIDDGVYTSTDHPADQPIQLHNEQSYTLNWPMKIWFFCMQPSLTGGCTPIADSRKILKRLKPQTVEKFSRKQIMYMRNYGDGLGLHWPEVFQTNDKPVVEQHCREASIELEWKDANRLRTRQVRPAIRTHPYTGEQSWFNHMLFFHITSLPPSVRDAFVFGIKEEDYPFNTYYGDGSPIEPSVLEEVREAYAQETVAFPWQKGDILMVDNMLVAHGREPFTGPRKIMVAMAELFNGKVAAGASK